MELDERKMKILKAIISTYLETGDPVGSRTIAKDSDLHLSSATIRNEMADLEELGYILQPHTSAGRIPSDLGYRYYVNCLMEENDEIRIRETEREKEHQDLINKMDRMEEVLKNVADLLAANTNYATLISTPQIKESKLKFIQLSMVDTQRLLVVIVVGNDTVKNVLMNMDEPLGNDEILKLNILLNSFLQGLTLNDINIELDEKEIDSWIRLTRVLTHEIMNSVTPITSLSDTLLSMVEDKDEEISHGLQTISTTGKGLLAFVESYRKFTRIPTPEPSLFYLKAFIERMVELARHQNPCDHITFHTKIDPADLILHADENLISQVVINLLKNAIQAIGDQPDGQIDILVYCNETEEVLIEIKNNGPVIPPEIAEHIFIPFFTTKEGGSGIGLSISRQIMRLSGGSLTLLPDHKETKFILKFK